MTNQLLHINSELLITLQEIDSDPDKLRSIGLTTKFKSIQIKQIHILYLITHDTRIRCNLGIFEVILELLQDYLVSENIKTVSEIFRDI